MVATRKKKAAQTAAPKETAEVASEPATLKAFHLGTDPSDSFGFSRFWWDGEGPREGIAGKVLKKFQPVPCPEGGTGITAARTDILLPCDAQADYMDVHHLLKQFDAKLPAGEKHAYLQITLRYPGAVNIHGPFEEARAFAWRHLVMERRLATILVVHAPFLAGSETSPLHVHLIAPLRRLGALGWGEMENRLQNDRGRADSHKAWVLFRQAWKLGGTRGGIDAVN
jgi:hypothetical protein